MATDISMIETPEDRMDLLEEEIAEDCNTDPNWFDSLDEEDEMTQEKWDAMSHEEKREYMSFLADRDDDRPNEECEIPL